MKPARGRRRQAAKKITKLEEYTNIENEKDEREQENLPAPMPSVSQRLTNSLKHISQLGGRLKPGVSLRQNHLHRVSDCTRGP